MKWELKLNLTTLLLLLAGVVLFFVVRFRESSLHKDVDRWKGNYAAQTATFESYVSRVDGILISKDELIQLKEKELREALQSDSVQREIAKKYKRLAGSVKIETEFIHDTIEVEVPIYIARDTTLELWHDCFDIDLSLTTGRLSVDLIDIQNTQDIIMGERRSSLFRTEYALDVRNSNPCVTTTGMSSFIVVHENKWWNNPLITVPGSFLIGYGAGKISK
jgi:hypothetical protein